ncbi:MAG: protein kinase, partial [Myxococcota bacterium]|nr:protein kinase [Myxococcota bacterium]
GRVLGSHGGIDSFLAHREGALGFSRRFMVKVVREGDGCTPLALERILYEARLGMHLAHPNLLPILDLDRADGCLFLLREWVDGFGLRALLNARGSSTSGLPRTAVLRIGIGVCQALSYLHDLQLPPWAPEGLAHRGVSPSNILVGRSGDVRLANLFTARACGSNASRSHEPADEPSLIPAYSAPEVRAGLPTASTADTFSLGVVLVEALSNSAALGGSTDSDWTRTRDREVLSATLHSLDLGDELVDLLSRCIQDDSSHRPDEVHQVEELLRRSLRDRHHSQGSKALRSLVREQPSPA